jgi:hypothetical protein
MLKKILMLNKILWLACLTALLLACDINPNLPGGGSTRSILSTPAGSFHAIIVADTNDFKIGKSVEVDLKNITTLVSKIEKNTRLKLNKTVITGDEFQAAKIKAAVENLSVNPSDLVIFYYAGHGVNTGDSSKWPSMHITDTNQYVELDWVTMMLKNKQPRFFIAMVDTCNVFLPPSKSQRSSQDRGVMPIGTNYYELFLKPRGHMIASSTSPDQEAGGDIDNGGKFTSHFLASLREGLASSQPSWRSITKEAEQTLYFTDDSGEEKRQDPQIELKLDQDPSSEAPEEPIRPEQPGTLTPPVPTLPEEIPNDHQLALQVLPKTQFEVGESMEIEVTNRGNQVGYVFIWDIDSEGKITRLLPSEISQQHRLTVGKTLKIPESNKFYQEFTLALSEPIGQGFIVAALVPESFKEMILNENFASKSIAYNAKTRLQQWREQLTQQVGASNVSIATMEYEISH